mmetsp:Transcript_110342/g.311241  ORF Transcript_110342/g.311241 Transcript_110342/m.311241 type:complete len:649 (+) Transcript_110342:61-2007(+)
MGDARPSEDVHFVERWGLGEEALQLLASLPPNVKDAVIYKFDGTGTKDGNVMGRLKGYVASQLRRAGVSMLPSPCGGGLISAADDETQIQAFLKRWNLGENAASLLRNVAPDVLSNVLMNFDGSNTKDGNVYGRLQAYLGRRIRGPVVSQLGGAKDPMSLFAADPAFLDPNALYDPTFGIDPSAFLDPSLYDPNFLTQALSQATQQPLQLAQLGLVEPLAISAEEMFLQQWGLGEEALSLLESLPVDIRTQVLQGFDGSGTKDGNVLGRLKGYVASQLRRAGLQLGGPVAAPLPPSSSVDTQLQPQQPQQPEQLQQSQQPQQMSQSVHEMQLQQAVQAANAAQARADAAQLRADTADARGKSLEQFIQRLQAELAGERDKNGMGAQNAQNVTEQLRVAMGRASSAEEAVANHRRVAEELQRRLSVAENRATILEQNSGRMRNEVAMALQKATQAEGALANQSKVVGEAQKRISEAETRKVALEAELQKHRQVLEEANKRVQDAEGRASQAVAQVRAEAVSQAQAAKAREVELEQEVLRLRGQLASVKDALKIAATAAVESASVAKAAAVRIQAAATAAGVVGVEEAATPSAQQTNEQVNGEVVKRERPNDERPSGVPAAGEAASGERGSSRDRRRSREDRGGEKRARQ